MGRKKDWIRSARGSGYFPMNFNFVRETVDKVTQCSYCGYFISVPKVTRDHVYPKSKGGIIKTPACQVCNDLKKDMLPISWAIYATKIGLAWHAFYEPEPELFATDVAA